MSQIGNCDENALTRDLICKAFSCATGMQKSEAIRYIGVLLCEIAGASSPDLFPIPSPGLEGSGIGAQVSYYGGSAYPTTRGIANVPFTSADITAVTNVTSLPEAGKKLVVTDIIISADADMKILLREETSGTLFETINIKGGTTIQITPIGKQKLATVNKRVTAQASVAGNVSITLHYYSEA